MLFFNYMYMCVCAQVQVPSEVADHMFLELELRVVMSLQTDVGLGTPLENVGPLKWAVHS